jgi:hypothetical protein
MSSRRYAKRYLKGVTGQKEYSTGFRYECRTRKDLKKADTEILRTDRIPQEKELLRRIQEPKYRTEKIKSLVKRCKTV